MYDWQLESIAIMEYNCKVKIHNYENGFRRGVNKRQLLNDIFDRLEYECDKIVYELIQKDKEACWRAKMDGVAYERVSKTAGIRIKSCVLASNGRTMKVNDLTESELIEARSIANNLVDEYVSNFKERIMSY